MKITEKLIEKSKEAFMMAIEVYNKPSIKSQAERLLWKIVLKRFLQMKRIRFEKILRKYWSLEIRELIL